MTALFRPRSIVEKKRTPSLVDVTLDPTQEVAIALPASRPLLVLGEAGHGKTTVLLHRVARVLRAEPDLRAVILVPTEGLVRLMRPLLRRLGADVDVWTFDRFAEKQARQAFRRLPRESDLTPPSVMRLKRSPALRSVLSEIAAREPGVIDDDRDAPVKRSRAHVVRGDLQHLFGDRLLMERVAREGALPAHAVGDVLDRTRVQFSATTESEWSHVLDRERLIAVDRRALDDGTSTGHASTLDAEDYVVLFEIDRLRALRRGVTPTTPRAFDLIAIDEAQELAPLELTLIGRSLREGGTLIVSGDADQHTDETSTFLGWPETMQALGAPDHETTTLEIGYRCPPEVVAMARAVRDGESAAAHVARYGDERTLATELGAELAAIRADDRSSSVAILCRRPLTARRFAELFGARLVFDGRFLPRGPVQVTITSEVKGLEFDWVLIPDANDREWPNDPPSRRAMYVAITRARHQVVFACSTNDAEPSHPSPLLAPSRSD